MPSLKNDVQVFARKIGRANEELQNAFNRRRGPKLLRRLAHLLKEVHGLQLVAIPPDLATEDYVEGELERALGPRPFEPGSEERRKKVLLKCERYQSEVLRRLRRIITVNYELDVDEFNEDRFLNMVDTGLAQMAIQVADYRRTVDVTGEVLAGVTIIDPPKLFVKVEGFTMRYFLWTLVFCHLKKRR